MTLTDDSNMSDWDVSDDWDGMDSDDGDSEDRFDSSGKQPVPPVLSPGCLPEEVCHLGLAGEHQEEVPTAPHNQGGTGSYYYVHTGSRRDDG